MGQKVCVFYIEKMKDKPYSHRKKNSCRILRNEKAKSLKQKQNLRPKYLTKPFINS